MKKALTKFFSLFLVLTMLIGLGVTAAETEHVKNGSFEEVKDDGSPSGWTFSGGKFGTDFFLDEDAKEGSKALKIKTEADSVFASQSIGTLVEGKKYKVSFWVKVMEQYGNGVAIKLELRDDDSMLQNGQLQQDYPSMAKKRWLNYTFDFTAPQGIKKAILLVRFYGGGEVFYDAVSLIGEGSSAVVEAEPQKPAENTEKKEETVTAPVQQPAQGKENVKNGSFESLKEDGSPKNWTFSGGAFGTDFHISKENTKDGENGLKIKTSASSVFASQAASVVGGVKYTLSFWTKVLEQGGKGAALKVEFLSTDGGTKNLGAAVAIQKEYTDIKKKEWVQEAFEFTAPEGASRAVILLRFYGGGEAYYDAVSLIGGEADVPADAKPVITEAKPPVDGQSNLVKNSNLETLLSDGRVENWSEVFNNDTKIVGTSTDAYSGNNSIRIQNDDSKQPWARQTITEGIVEDAEYTTTAWVKTSGAETIKFKWEFRRRNDRIGDDYFISGEHTDALKTTPGVWTKVVATTRIPAECKVVDLYVRLFGEGDVLWDDVEFYMTEQPPIMYSDSDVYYYTEWVLGKASVEINDYYPIAADSRVEFVLRDGETVLNSATTALTGTKAEYEFKLSYLAEIGKEYFIDVIYKDAAGAVIDKKTESVYRYNRPTRLNEDGLIIENGEVFTPVIGYHVPFEALSKVAAAGINTVQSYASRNAEGRVANSTDIPYLLEYLDEAHKYNIKVLVVLYPNMLPAGHPNNAEKTKACVAAVKDHPATLGYMVMDEPYNHVGTNGATYEDFDNWLQASYKVIRDIDPNNVVFACLTGYRQEVAIKFVDIMGRDPYPPSNRQMSIYVSDNVASATDVAACRKPVWVINCATTIAGGYTPNNNDVRHMSYQALFEGANALGWYNVAAGKEGTINIPKPIWDREGIWEGVESFAANEQEDAFKHFITGEYPLFAGSQQPDATYWYRAFVKNGELYVIALSRSTGEIQVEIPLVSYDGSIKIDGFKATPDSFSGLAELSDTGALRFTMEPEQVIRFKVVPTSAVDFSALTTDAYRDLANYPWAVNQIKQIAEKGIANHKGYRSFVPGEKITRADFAYFLIRTLGLSSDATEIFADVDPDAYYAKEMAIGKALGILKGVGDDKYNPYAEISRQDMMVICARGMRYASKLGEGGTLDTVSAFTDKDLIASYAVEDIAAMVREQIVIGNADGTINPLGNATRAEAAVIMSRILNK
ncbi:MAG: carbohydrate binding domain-containing protein [Clostridia bacterium]|nr:carbohydrate binding domain-containing protein [Clostridia bacterium]